MRLGIISSMILERQHRRLTVNCTGGLPATVYIFGTEREVLDRYDQLVAIEEKENNVDPS
jgi:hypothetical protein